uniref:Uncharacterized protein n=1 Tax=Dicentrarchus labrax TaxID=13489 RepID=A0A8P4KN74_DICLA
MINAEFQRITTHPLETTFMAQLDSLQPQLTSVFQRKGVVTEATSDVHSKRAAVLRALCLYLGEDDGHLIHEYMDIKGNDIQTGMQRCTMGIYVISKENGDPGHYDDTGMFNEGVIILDNIGSEAQACAVMLGVIYALNLAYPKELRHYYEFIQKVLFVYSVNCEGMSSVISNATAVSVPRR